MKKTRILALLLCLSLVMSMATAVYAETSIVLETVIIDKNTTIAELIEDRMLENETEENKALANQVAKEFSANDIVRVIIAQNDYSNMFILGQ